MLHCVRFTKSISNYDANFYKSKPVHSLLILCQYVNVLSEVIDKYLKFVDDLIFFSLSMVKKISFDNIIDETQKFCDTHLNAIQRTLYVLFGGTAIYITRRLYLGKEFQTISDIPLSFIEKKIAIRGQVLKVCGDGLLHIKHIPVINLSRFTLSSSRNESANKGIIVKLAGINLSDKHQLQIRKELENLKNRKVWMEIVYREEDDDTVKKDVYLHCLVSRQWAFISFCVNYRLLRLGLAQVCPLPGNIINQRLTDKLFKAQKKAIFWKRGIWRKTGRWF